MNRCADSVYIGYVIKMFLYDAEPALWEFYLTLGVLLIAAIVLLSYFISTIIDLALRPRTRPRTLVKTPPSTPSSVPEPKSKARAKIERKKVKNERKMPSRRNRNSPPNKIEAARNARIQSTIEAHRQALQRLHEGRKMALSLRRATDEMIKRSKLEMAGKAEHWKEISSELSAIKRERMQALRAWVKEIEEDTSLPLASVERQSQMWAEIRERQERERQESLQNQEKTAATENSADMASTKNKQDEENTKGTKMPFCRVLGDSKTIKMKFGKNNKLANLMEHCQIGDGFYVSL